MMPNDLEFLFRGNKVGESHFGANYLATRQNFSQTIEGQNLYGEAALALGVKGFRYPGGTITEKFFDISDKRHFEYNSIDPIHVSNYFDQSEQTPITRLGSFLKFADQYGEKVTVVIPTIRYFQDLTSKSKIEILAVEAELKSFIHKVLSGPYGHTIEAFEIGNEFPSWVAGHNERILEDSVDFAMITRNFSVWIDEAIHSSGTNYSPSILAQAAFVLHGPRGNKVLLESIFNDGLSNEYPHVESLENAYRAIDGVTVHSYPNTPWSTDELGLESLDRDIELFRRWQVAFDRYETATGVEKPDLIRAVTEWNTRNLAMNNGLVEGIQGATGTVASFYHLVRNDVDLMHVWPVLQNTTSALVDSKNHQLSMNFNGAAFSILEANVMGLRAHQGKTHYDLDGDGQLDALVQLYTSSEKTVLVVASVSNYHQSFSLNFPMEMFDVSGSAWTSFSLLSTEPDATSVFGEPVINSSVEHVWFSREKGEGNYSISPWEINFSVFSGRLNSPTDDRSNLLQDSTSLKFSIEDFSDIPGDSLLARLNAGAVTLVATENSDVVSAVPGFLVNALEGNDTIFGTAFADTILGGPGDDVIFLHSGLIGDVVHGGYGQDQINFGSAANLLLGGPDDDVFVFRPSATHDGNTFAVNTSNSIQAGTLDWVSVAGYSRIESIIDGGTGHDVLILSNGNDALFMDDEVSGYFKLAGRSYQPSQRIVSIEEIRAGAGDDVIDLTSSKIRDRPSNFEIFGEEGDDIIWSSEGNDHLYGGAGNDTIFSGAGVDHIFGGPGADTFVFTRSSVQVTLHDFSIEEGDILRFVNSDGNIFNQNSLRIMENQATIKGLAYDSSEFQLTIQIIHSELNYV